MPIRQNNYLGHLCYFVFLILIIGSSIYAQSFQENYTFMDKLILNQDVSIILPHFDTTAILGNEIEKIILNLYLLDFSSTRGNEFDKIHLTINPYNPITNEVKDGISTFISPKINSYISLELPRELFLKIIGSNERFLMRMVDSGKNMIFAGPDYAGTIKDPFLEVTYATSTGKEIDKKQDLVINNNYYNIENSKVQFAQGENIKQEMDSDNKWYPWVVAIIGGLFVTFIVYLIKKWLE